MADVKHLHDGHRKRMRERFEVGGFTGYQPHEVLEQLLFDVIPRGDTNQIAHQLIEKFGSLDGVFSAKKEELLEIKGIGERSAEYILSLYPAVGEELLKQYKSADDMSIYELVIMFDWFIKVCRDERMYVAILDSAPRLLDFFPVDDDCYVPTEIAHRTENFQDAEVMYLVCRDKNKLDEDMIRKTASLLEKCKICDCLYLCESGYASVMHEGAVLEMYKKQKSSIKKLISRNR